MNNLQEVLQRTSFNSVQIEFLSDLCRDLGIVFISTFTLGPLVLKTGERTFTFIGVISAILLW